MAVILSFLFYKISQDVPLKVIYHYDRYVEGDAEGFSKRSTHQQGSKETRSTCKCNCSKVGGLYPSLFKSLADNRNDVLLMGPGGKFWDHSTEIFMYLLARDNVGEQESVFQHCRRSIVAARFDSEDKIRHDIQRDWNCLQR